MSKGIPEGVIAPSWAADLDIDWDEILSRPKMPTRQLVWLTTGYDPDMLGPIGTADIVYRRARP